MTPSATSRGCSSPPTPTPASAGRSTSSSAATRRPRSTTVDDALALLPGEENLRFLRSGALIASGATDDGIAELRSLVAEQPGWGVIVRGFVAKGLVALPEGVDVDAVLG